jgi:hypothetical protein
MVSSSLPWDFDIYPGQLICLWADFYLGPFDSAFGSASLPLSEPSDKHLPPFRLLPCSSHRGYHISGHSCIWKPLIIALSMTCPDVQFIEFLSVFFHCHQLLSQVLHSPEQSNLVISGDEFCLQLCDHSVPVLDILLSLTASVSLYFIPPQCCMSLQSCDIMLEFLVFLDIFIVEVCV